jgi:FAD:protein FMN transferase
MIELISQVFSREVKLMGNQFQFSVVSDNEEWALQRIYEAIAEVERIEQLLTTFKDTSQTNLINANAGIAPVAVDKEVFDLIQRSIRISALTQGAFDITYGSVDKRLWNFDVNMQSLPDEKTARRMVRLINYQNVVLDKDAQTVFLKEKGMRIGFGAIGKGYAADRAKLVMQLNGVKHGIVNASGDLTVWGNQPNGDPWTIGIADPDKKNLPFAAVKLTDVSVATSGNYEKFAVINGKKYSHTIDPKTGLPITGIKSTTIISRHAEIADAMTTPVMVMGIKAGLSMINQLKEVACIIIDDHNRIYTSTNINLKGYAK